MAIAAAFVEQNARVHGHVGGFPGQHVALFVQPERGVVDAVLGWNVGDLIGALGSPIPRNRGVFGNYANTDYVGIEVVKDMVLDSNSGDRWFPVLWCLGVRDSFAFTKVGKDKYIVGFTHDGKLIAEEIKKEDIPVKLHKRDQKLRGIVLKLLKRKHSDFLYDLS